MGDFDSKKEDYEIMDVENWGGSKNMVFSHQGMVMKALNRVIELCGHELTEGTNETFTDPRNGTTKVVYKEDTKKAFITAVKVCKVVMRCDFDQTAKDNVKTIFDAVATKKNELLTSQWNYFNSLSRREVQDRKLVIYKEFLHKDLPFYKEFVEFEVEAYLELYEELHNLTERKGFYEAEEIIG